MTEQERRLEYMPLHEIGRADRNPKRHDREGIGRSMEKFGVVELPAIDERTGKLVAGHGRLDSWLDAQREGKTPPAGIKIGEDGTWLAPIIRGWASETDADAEAYLVASNQLVINGGWDERALAGLLDDLAAEDDALLQVTGFDDDTLDRLLSSTDAIGGPAGGFLEDLRDPFGTSQAPPPPQAPPAYDWPPAAGGTLPAGDGPIGGEPFDNDDDQGAPVSPAGPSVPTSFPTTAYTPAGTAAQYAPMSWVLHETDRKTVRTALTHLQKTREIPTSAEALVALCRDYVQANSLADNAEALEESTP